VSPRIDSAVSPDLVEAARMLVVPLGSTEQHGPHLAVSTDSVIAQGWADAFAREVEEPVLVGPVLPYGASGEHQDFAGTISIGTEALVVVLVELARSAAHRFDRVIFLSGHAGNLSALERATRQLRAEGHTVDALVPVMPDSDAHAGRTETSLMLHLAPELVEADRAEVGVVTPIDELLPLLRAGGTAAVSSNGVLGDPTGASASEGARLLGLLVAHARDVTGL
jgi:creatinine amidohydrolase